MWQSIGTPSRIPLPFQLEIKNNWIFKVQNLWLIASRGFRKSWVVNKPEGLDTFGWSLRLAIMHDLGLAPSKRFFCEPLWLHPSPDISVISTSLSKFRSARLRNFILFTFPPFGTINDSFELEGHQHVHPFALDIQVIWFEGNHKTLRYYLLELKVSIPLSVVSAFWMTSSIPVREDEQCLSISFFWVTIPGNWLLWLLVTSIKPLQIKPWYPIIIWKWILDA